MLLMGIPFLNAAEVVADLVECGLNIVVAIPALVIVTRIHLLSVALVTGECGFV